MLQNNGVKLAPKCQHSNEQFLIHGSAQTSKCGLRGLINLNKVIKTIVAALLTVSIAGCGVNNGANDEAATSNTTRPVGFDREDNQWKTNTKNSAFTMINDRGHNDQRLFSTQDASKEAEERGNRIGAFSNRGFYGHNDYNFHGQMNTTYNGRPTWSYNTGHDNTIAQKITDRIEHLTNVNDVAAFIDGNTILVVIDKNDNNNRDIEQEVRRIAEGMANGRTVKVVSE